MNAAFVDGIAEPSHPQMQTLQRQAQETVTDRLAQYDIESVPDHVLQQLTYTYYHDWETDDPSYVFLLEDPGTPGEHVIHEISAYADLGADPDIWDTIAIDRRFGARWLATNRYTDFTSEFITLCEAAGLIETAHPWWRYLLGGHFFDDFYMGDVVKYRAPSVGSGDVRVSFTEYLYDEVEALDPELIFAFGKRAWETVRDNLLAEPTAEAPASQSVLDVHGVLHQTKRPPKTYVLPLGHMSPNFRGAQLPHAEYMEGLERGLSRFQNA